MIDKTKNDIGLLANRKVLVTGAAGFIGSHLCEALVRGGATVIALDDMSAGKQSNVRLLSDFPNYSFIRASVCDDSQEMDRIFDGVDTVFHNAASKKNICLLNPQRDLAVNGGGALNVLSYAKKHGTRKFVHASTGSVYGEPCIFPTTESHPLNPVSYYGVSKLAGERYVDVFYRLYGLDTTILRYFHVYGPRQESNEFGGVVSIFLRAISEGKSPVVFGDGEQVRSFTYVRDLVEANLRAAVMPVAAGQVYNVASGLTVSINELADKMIEYMGRPGICVARAEPLLGDIYKFDISNKKICTELNMGFNQDFWGTLKASVQDVEEYLAIDAQ